MSLLSYVSPLSSSKNICLFAENRVAVELAEWYELYILNPASEPMGTYTLLPEKYASEDSTKLSLSAI